tara:strand:+ start:126 stop:527 length:402 start_codon:yes stop_codon:yes gene_type:complete
MKKLFLTLTFCFTFVPSLIKLPKVNSEEYRCKFTHLSGGERVNYQFETDYIRSGSTFYERRGGDGEINHYDYNIDFENDKYIILLANYYKTIGATWTVFIDKENNEVYSATLHMRNDKRNQPHGTFGKCDVVF